jgi:hypothetical protein
MGLQMQSGFALIVQWALCLVASSGKIHDCLIRKWIENLQMDMQRQLRRDVA